jgi:hypothetical protein
MTEKRSIQSARQLPADDQVFLDHLAHFVADPHAATEALKRAGFAPTPVSVQVNPGEAGGPARPTGTGNVTGMFAQGYIEVLFKTAATPLSQELDAAIARYAGVHLIAFSVADATEAHHRLGGQGFRVRPLVHMERPVETEGKPGKAAFTLARPEAGEMPEGRIQFLTHHTEQMVWQPRWLSHPNGARALASVTVVVNNVDEAAQRFARFTGRETTRSLRGVTVTLDRGAIELTSADAFAQLLPDIPIPSLPFIGAYGIKVASLSAIEELLRRAGIAARRHEHDLAVKFPQELGQGAWLFTQ